VAEEKEQKKEKEQKEKEQKQKEQKQKEQTKSSHVAYTGGVCKEHIHSSRHGYR
jgi:hypothetical protein